MCPAGAAEGEHLLTKLRRQFMSGDGSENEIDTEDELEDARKVKLRCCVHLLLVSAATVKSSALFLQSILAAVVLHSSSLGCSTLFLQSCL